MNVCHIPKENESLRKLRYTHLIFKLQVEISYINYVNFYFKLKPSDDLNSSLLSNESNEDLFHKAISTSESESDPEEVITIFSSDPPSPDIFDANRSLTDVLTSSEHSFDNIVSDIGCAQEEYFVDDLDLESVEDDYFPLDLESEPENDDLLEESENESNLNDEDEPVGDKYSGLLHPNLKTTKLEALQMILTYFMRHKLSFVALEDLLLLVNCLFQQECLPRTKHSFFKLFSNQYTAQYHFYCTTKDCGNTLFTCQDRNIKRNIICDVCLFENVIKCSSENFFVTLPLEQQLREVIQQNAEDLRCKNAEPVNTNSMRDIKDGKFYEKFLLTKNNGRNKITLVMNTDGVQVFKSKNKSLWPIQVFVNELDVRKRFLIKNILVLGLWYDPIHPKMPSLLNPLMMELRQLNQSGKIFLWY